MNGLNGFLILSPFALNFLIFSPFPHSLSISSFSLHFLFISSFSLHFLFISSFSLHFLAARLQGCNDSCSPGGAPPGPLKLPQVFRRTSFLSGTQSIQSTFECIAVLPPSSICDGIFSPNNSKLNALSLLALMIEELALVQI